MIFIERKISSWTGQQQQKIQMNSTKVMLARPHIQNNCKRLGKLFLIRDRNGSYGPCNTLRAIHF